MKKLGSSTAPAEKSGDPLPMLGTELGPRGRGVFLQRSSQNLHEEANESPWNPT